MSSYSLQDLLYLMTRLRDPLDGCPWDRQQDFSSIAPYTIEESYELADAIAAGDFSQIREELGDVLFQVVFYAQMGAEQKQFNFDDIVSGLVNKLVKRHPHVFPQGELQRRAGTAVADSDELTQSWERIKAEERQGKKQHSAMDDIPLNFPALSRAVKLQKRAAGDGFDWPHIDGVFEKLQEEMAELMAARIENQQQTIEEELGDVLFSCVNLARHLRVDPETALRAANHKFEQRYRYIEQQLEQAGASTSSAELEQLDQLWDEAKRKGY